MPTPNRGSVVPLLEQSTRGQAHPLAATIALRSMVDFTLANARSSRYGHAAYLAPDPPEPCPQERLLKADAGHRNGPVRLRPPIPLASIAALMGRVALGTLQNGAAG